MTADMRKIVVFGNSGSGKSTLARQYSTLYELAHLDLDTLAWQDTSPPKRASLFQSKAKIAHFLAANPGWIIEGCYADLLALAATSATELIFLNPGVETCVTNCRNRPWEKHKYKSKKEQDKNLEMLLGWVRQYPIRSDEFSLAAHQKLFCEFSGKKRHLTSN